MKLSFFLFSGSSLDNVLVLSCGKIASSAKSKYGYQCVGLPQTKENLIRTELSPAVRWNFRLKRSVFMWAEQKKGAKTNSRNNWSIGSGELNADYTSQQPAAPSKLSAQ
jgi:hypothetical protein